MIGRQVGCWRIIEVLGEGTQGTVYAARHVTLPREAAVKLLLPRLARDPDRVERFFDEARAASSIEHPGVVEVYDCGREPDGPTYIAMERLRGETLHARLRRAPPSLGEALAIVRQLAEALAVAHEANVVHRDLKPENVFLAEEMGTVRIKLVDFGIAKLAPELRGAGTLTGAGLFGTPPYMSPEQCSGTETIDHRTDLYALGCLLHELVTGTPPFGFDGVAELVEAHRHDAPPRLSAGCPDIPDALDELAVRLLAKDPDARPASCREVVEILDRIGGATSIAPSASAERAPLAPTLLEPAHGWRAAAWQWLLGVEPWIAAGFTCLAGAVLFALSIVTGVGDSFGASNWAVTFIVLVPLIVAFQLKVMRRTDEALGELVKRGMLRARAGTDPGVAMRESTRRLGVGLVGFGIAVCAASIPVSIAEWHHRWRNLRIAGTWWTESMLLGVIGAIAQGLLIALILVFVVHAIAWTHIVHQLSLPRSLVHLTADRGSADPRRGFEVFEAPVLLTLITGGLVQLSLYLSNAQHFGEQVGTAWFGVILPPGDLLGPDGLFDFGTGKYPSTTTLLATMLLLGFLTAAGFMLWRAARESQQDAAGEAWPLPRLGPARAMTLLVIAALGTFFYRLGPGLLVVGIAIAAVRRFTRPRMA